MLFRSAIQRHGVTTEQQKSVSESESQILPGSESQIRVSVDSPQVLPEAGTFISCVFVHVCMCVCMFEHVCVPAQTCVTCALIALKCFQKKQVHLFHACLSMYVCACMFEHVCVCVCVHVLHQKRLTVGWAEYIYTHTYIHTYIYTCI